MANEKIIFIVGPTATGKTRLAIKIARKMSGEIISCDSMQVYKGMRVLSQAPTAMDRRMVKHHLVSILDPAKEYSVADFKDRAEEIIRSIIKRGKVPIVVGGSGLYIKALVDGLFPPPRADLKFRRDMQRFVRRYGSKRLHARLSKIDPESAASIHPNDARRIIRALEIYNSTGRTMTEHKKETKGLGDNYDLRIFGLTAPREIIYRKIEARVDNMVEEGMVREVGKLRKKRLSKTARAALGIKEICGYLDGDYGIEEARDALKMNTRRFAKRQLAWFRADSRIRWFDVSKINDKEIAKKIICRFAS